MPAVTLHFSPLPPPECLHAGQHAGGGSGAGGGGGARGSKGAKQGAHHGRSSVGDGPPAGAYFVPFRST